MDAKRLLIGSVVGGVMLTLTGGLIWGVLFADFFEGQMSVTMRETPVVWAGLVSSLAHGLLLTLVMGWANVTSVADGLKTGATVGFLLWFGADFIMYATFEMATLTGALADSVLALVPGGIAGAAIVAVHRRGTVSASTKA